MTAKLRRDGKIAKTLRGGPFAGSTFPLTACHGGTLKFVARGMLGYYDGGGRWVGLQRPEDPNDNIVLSTTE